MARLVFPDEASRLVYRINPGGALASAPAASVVFYSDAAATVLADVRVHNGTATAGAALAGSSVTTDAFSRLPLFWGPDNGADTLYAVGSSGPASVVYSRFDDRVDAITGAIVTSVAGRAGAVVLAQGDVTNLVTDLGAKVAKNAQVYYVRDHGVLADGVTNDKPAMDALMTTVSNAGGGRVLLPANATILVNGVITPPSNTTIEGQGWGSVIKLGVNIAGFGVINIGAVTRVMLRNFKIDGQRATLTGINSGVQARAPGGCSEITVDDVWVDSVAYAGIIFLGDTTRVTVTNGIKIVNCKTTNTGGHGILCQDAVDNALIDNCTVLSYARTYDVCGITNGRNAWDTWMTNCKVDGTATTGVSANGVSIDTPLGRAVCTGNNVVNTVGLGIEIGYARDAVVANNVVTDGTRSGIQFTGDAGSANGSSSSGVSVTGNTVARCATGIGTQMGTPAALATPADRVPTRSTAYTLNQLAVEANRLYKVTTAGTSSAAPAPATLGTTGTGATVTDGTVVWTDQGPVHSNISITGNTIRSCTGTGIDLNYTYFAAVTGNQVTRCGGSGIFVATNSNFFTVVGNDLEGNNTLASASHGSLKIDTLANVLHIGQVGQNSLRNSGLLGTDFYVTQAGIRMDGRIPAGATAPSVAFNDQWYTANTAATSIASFVDPNSKFRLITVFVTDAFTTFVHTAAGTNTLRLSGGVNYTPAANTVMQFVLTSTSVQWFEVSRVTVG